MVNLSCQIGYRSIKISETIKVKCYYMKINVIVLSNVSLISFILKETSATYNIHSIDAGIS